MEVLDYFAVMAMAAPIRDAPEEEPPDDRHGGLQTTSVDDDADPGSAGGRSTNQRPAQS